MPALQFYQSSYQKTDLPHENFTSVSNIGFSGGKYLKKYFIGISGVLGVYFMFQDISSKKKIFSKIFLSPIYLVYLWIYL